METAHKVLALGDKYRNKIRQERELEFRDTDTGIASRLNWKYDTSAIRRRTRYRTLSVVKASMHWSATAPAAAATAAAVTIAPRCCSRPT